MLTDDRAQREVRPGRLIVRAQAGLGNRLNGLLSAMVIADILCVPLEIVWPTTDFACFGLFSALFDPVGLDGAIFRPEETGMTWTDARSVSGAELRRAMENGETLWLAAYTIFGFDLCEGWKFFEAIREKLRRLQPVAEVRALIDKVSPTPIGLHIRFGDHFGCYTFTPRWCYRSALAVIGQSFPHLPIFICSDTAEFVDELQQNSSALIQTSPTKEISSLALRGTLEGSRAALADLCILARCKIIISAPLSSFATTAQSLGGGISCFIARVANTNKFRRTQTAWKIQEYIERDLLAKKWVHPKTRALNSSSKWIASAAVFWANIISSDWYQDRPWAFTRHRFEKRFRQFLDSAAFQQALLKAAPSGSRNGHINHD